MSQTTCKLIPFVANPGNAVVVGRTRSGKTWGTLESLKNAQQGVFFFNVQLSPVPKGFIDCNMDNSIETIKKALARGEKINYLPHTQRKAADAEFAYIINQLYDGKERKIFIVADEVHLYEKQAGKALTRLATTCLRFGMKTIFISQRPAEMDHTCMTQSTLFTVFNVSPMEWPYFEQKKFPVQEMKSRLAAGGEYAYVTVDTASNEAITGPYKV